jgi:DNA polymerase I-like protein with 3'-5' exonuclease and polymerase domains
MDYRDLHGLHYRIVNQIHDAVIIECPIDEIEQAKTMFKETMGNIRIPIPGYPLTLGIDITVMSRWGEKYKP